MTLGRFLYLLKDIFGGFAKMTKTPRQQKQSFPLEAVFGGLLAVNLLPHAPAVDAPTRVTRPCSGSLFRSSAWSG